jgi:membrane protein HdeD
MAETVKGRTGVDLVLGALQVLVGLVILGHTAVATTLSLMFVGWLIFATGVFVLALSLFQIGKDGFWSGFLGGGLMTVLGVVFLRHTTAAALTVTLVAGALFTAVGIARLSAAFAFPEHRLPLLLGGVVSLGLGLVVLFNLADLTYTLLGILLGIQVVTEGLAIMVFGREARRTGRLGTDDRETPATA